MRRNLAHGFACDDGGGASFRRHGFGGAHHEPFEDDLPVSCGDARLEVAAHIFEIDGVEMRPCSVRPEVRHHLHDLHGFELVISASEIAEHIVEFDSSLVE